MSNMIEKTERKLEESRQLIQKSRQLIKDPMPTAEIHISRRRPNVKSKPSPRETKGNHYTTTKV